MSALDAGLNPKMIQREVYKRGKPWPWTDRYYGNPNGGPRYWRGVGFGVWLTLIVEAVLLLVWAL